MNLYEIIGLKKENIDWFSYETNSSNYILKDETGYAIRKPRSFTRYTIYITLKNSYYAIHLSKHDCGSFSGKLCYIGMMKILHTNYDDFYPTMTHFPIKPLFIFINLESIELYYTDFMDIYLHDEPDTFVFKFSSVGDNERDPWGYVYVNMDLFRDSLEI